MTIRGEAPGRGSPASARDDLADLLSRIAAFGIACVMAVAVVKVHLPNGFFMNWAETQHGEGFEFHILAIGMALAIMIGGAGAASGDRMLSRARS